MENLFELEKKILKSNSPDEIDKITENMTQQQLRDMIKLLIDILTPQNIKINKMINENYKKYPDCEHRKEIEVMGVMCKSGLLEELCDSIKQDIQSECKSRSMIIVYTNLPEDEIESIKNLVGKLESDHFCRYGIVMCK